MSSIAPSLAMDLNAFRRGTQAGDRSASWKRDATCWDTSGCSGRRWEAWLKACHLGGKGRNQSDGARADSGAGREPRKQEQPPGSSGGNSQPWAWRCARGCIHILIGCSCTCSFASWSIDLVHAAFLLACRGLGPE
jgi:hypothetical protein